LLEVNAAVGELFERLLRLLGRVGDQGVFFGRVLFRSLFLMKSYERVSLRVVRRNRAEKKQAPKEREAKRKMYEKPRARNPDANVHSPLARENIA